MEFDSSNQETVLFGGNLEWGGFMGDTWVFKLLNLYPHPPGRILGSMAYDSTINKIFLFSGFREEIPEVCDDLWVLERNSTCAFWTLLMENSFEKSIQSNSMEILRKPIKLVFQCYLYLFSI